VTRFSKMQILIDSMELHVKDSQKGGVYCMALSGGAYGQMDDTHGVEVKMYHRWRFGYFVIFNLAPNSRFRLLTKPIVIDPS